MGKVLMAVVNVNNSDNIPCQGKGPDHVSEECSESYGITHAKRPATCCPSKGIASERVFQILRPNT